MNYPFSTVHSQNFRRMASIVLVIIMVSAMLTGCFSKKNSEPTEDTSSNMPNLVDVNPIEPSSEETEPASEAETEPENDGLAIVKEQLNVRSSPSTGSNVNSQLDAGEKVEVLRVEPVNGVQWAYIKGDDASNAKGWVSTDMLDMSNVDPAITSSASTTTPAATTPTKAEETTAGSTTSANTTTSGNGTMGVITASELNIRSEASSSSTRAGGLKYGDRVTILETKNGWGRIKQGWISLDYVYVDGNTGKNTCTGTVTASQLLVRNGPGSTYTQVSSLANGARVEVLEQIKVGNTVWGCIKGGWICMDYVNATGKLEANTTNSNTNNNSGTGIGTATVTGNGLNIRSGAGTNYGVVGGLQKGDTVTILEKTDVAGSTWGKISQGWICLDYARMN